MPEGTVGPFPAIRFPHFSARPPWLGGDLQTLRNAVLAALGRPMPDLAAYPSERLRFTMEDGTGDVLIGTCNRPTAAVDKPLAVLVHGLTGCETSHYMLASAVLLLERGYPVLRLNLRGAGPSRPVCKLQYHAGRSRDLRIVLEQLPMSLTRHGVVLVGYSLGGNMMLKLLGEEGQSARVRAAVSVSAPIDLKASQISIMRPRNAGYHRYLLSRMRAEAMAPDVEIEESYREAARAARTVYEFDDRFVAPRNGFGTAEVYYRESGAIGYLSGIRVPTLVIHAQDDPWIPADAYLAFPWEDVPHLKPLLPSGGGHVGFHGTGGPPAWHDRCLLAFFEAS